MIRFSIWKTTFFPPRSAIGHIWIKFAAQGRTGWGSHVERCEDCAHTRIAYNSCRNRHCPKCQWRTAAAWLAAREAELLPVPYFHLVFRLPAALGPIALQNKALVYGLLLKAAAETLITLAGDRKQLARDLHAEVSAFIRSPASIVTNANDE